MCPQGEGYAIRHSGNLEANMCIDLENISSQNMEIWNSFIFQAIAFNSDNDIYPPLHVISENPSELFRKRGSFQSPLYSEKPALEIPLVSDGKPVVCPKPDAQALKNAMGGATEASLKALRKKYNTDLRRSRQKKNRLIVNSITTDHIEVDLHIHALIDNLHGLTNTDMLMKQLDTVRQTMKANQKFSGRKIIFIHGKGEGILRNALRDLINKEFKGCTVEDASFCKYGFGATQVIIKRPS